MDNIMQLMEWELAINKGKGKGKGMGKGKGKGKGEIKGKGAAKGEGKAKGKGKTSWDANPASPSSRSHGSSSCTRCGKASHTAAECYHKDKVCDNCGKKGHLKAVCWLEGQAAECEESTTTTTKVVAPWTCMTCFVTHEDPYLKKCPKCKTVRIHPDSEKDEKEETEKTMIAKNIVRVMEGGDGDGKKGDSGDGRTEEKEEQEELRKLERLISSMKTCGILSAVKEAEEKKETILKKRKEKPTEMSTSQTAKDVLAERIRLLKQSEDRISKLETRAEEATAARIKQAEEKTKAIEREKERHEKAMKKLDEEFAMAEKHQTRRHEAAKEDIEKVKEQYQKDIQKIDSFLSSHPVMVEVPMPEAKKEKQPLNLETIKQHLQADQTLTSGQQLSPELIANSLLSLVEKLNQDKKEESTVADTIMEAAGAKRPVSPTKGDGPKGSKLPKTVDEEKMDEDAENL